MAHKSRNVSSILLEHDDAWFKLWLNSLLHTGPVVVEFTKVDGSMRTMRCTLNEGLIETAAADEPGDDTTSPKKFRNTSPDVRTVWDIDSRGWRSFRWGSLVNVSWDDGEVE